MDRKKRGREQQLPLQPPFRQGEEVDEFRKQLKQFKIQQNNLKNFRTLQNSLHVRMLKELGKKNIPHRGMIRKTPNQRCQI
jgi:hypothetical protein